MIVTTKNNHNHTRGNRYAIIVATILIIMDIFDLVSLFVAFAINELLPLSTTVLLVSKVYDNPVRFKIIPYNITVVFAK